MAPSAPSPPSPPSASTSPPQAAGFTAALAQCIAGSSFAALPPDAREASARILADSVGVTLGGTRSEVAEPLWRYLDGEDTDSGSNATCPILGTGRRASAEMAALANATFGAALDFDDVLSPMVAHPSVLVLAAALSCAGEKGRTISGPDLIEAHAVGLEAGARISKLITNAHYDQGFHNSGSLGIFSTLAALARLLRLPAPTVQAALGIAGSMAAGLRRNFGTMTKPLHSGWAARSAIAAVRLARAGLTAAPDAIEGRAGFLDAYGVNGQRGNAALETWGSTWVVTAPGVSLRKFACYNALQRPMQGVLELREQMGFTADTLEKLDCRVPPGGLQGAIYAAPTTGLEGKFSLPYVLAAGVLDGEYGLATFDDAAVLRPQITELISHRITAREDESCIADDPHYATRTASTRGFVEVEAWTRDGRHAKVRVKRPPGHPERPLDWDELRHKFLDCAGYGGVTAERALPVFEALRRLEDCEDVLAMLEPVY